MTYKICPTCFQEMHLPPDVPRFKLSPAEMMVFLKLYRHRGQKVPLESFGAARSTMHVHIGRLRAKLRDSGALYVIHTQTGRDARTTSSYMLTAIAPKAESSPGCDFGPDPSSAAERPEDLHS